MRLPTDRAATALARLYATAEAQLRALVAEAVASGALGTARYRQTRLAEVQRILADLNGEAIPEATQVVADAYTLGGQIAGIEGAFGTGIHQEAVDVLADALTSSLNDATERVGRQASDVFRREGLRHAALDLIAGGTQRDAAKELRATLLRRGVSGFRDRAGRDWGLSTYAEMVVRTTTREAVSTATKNTLVERGDDLVTISSHRHESDVCDRFDGKTFSLTGATEGHPVLDQLPPFHPNCLMPDMEVLGDAKAVLRRHYEGEIVVVHTAEGRRLACTPNHPVLTFRGWVAAGRLTDRDHLAGCSDPKLVLAAIDPDHDWQPAFIGEKAESLTVVFRGMPAAPEHFHGDGRGSDVYEVLADRDLRFGFGAHVGQPTDERELVVADVRLRPPLNERAGAQLSVGALATANRSVGGIDARRSSSSGDALLAQAVVDRASPTAERFRDLCCRLAVEESPDDLVFRYIDAAAARQTQRFATRAQRNALREQDLSDRGVAAAVQAREVVHGVAGQVAADKIVNVDRSIYSGQVLDLSTSVGWYIAAGLIVHNCVHVLTPATANLDALERELGLAQPALAAA